MANNQNGEKRNRVLFGVALLAFAAVLVIAQGWVLRIFYIFLTMGAVWEVQNALSHGEKKPARYPALLFAALLEPVYFLLGKGVIVPFAAFCCAIAFAGEVFKGETDFEKVLLSIVPIVYPAMFIAMGMFLQDLSDGVISRIAFLQTVLVGVGCDTFAWFFGSRFGKRKLAPVISPKKSVEGAIAGLFGAVLGAILVPLVSCAFVPNLSMVLPPLWAYALMGLVGGAFAQVGDLAASLIKRHYGIKDFSNVIPGHGGVMDRLDSLVFTVIVVYTFYCIFA